MSNKQSAISRLIRGGVTAMTALVLVSAAVAQTYVISGNTPGFIKKAADQGAVDPTTVISVTAWLQLHNQNKLDSLAQSVNQKGSSSYHQWITQDQFNSTYAPKAQEVKAVQNFLQAHGLTLLTVAENNLYVKVQGTVGQIEKAFHVQIDNFSFNGNVYMANTANPSVNDSSGGLIAAVTGLDDFGFQPTAVRPNGPDGTLAPIPLSSTSNGFFFASQCFLGPQSVTFTGGGNTATYSGSRYGADISNTALGTLAPCGYQPSEVQTAYNMNPLYAAGLDGTGQTIVITDAFGDATIASDAEVFSQLYGLPDLTSSNFQIVSAPGTVTHPATKRFVAPSGWADEITLDVEWVHAMAPGANIVLVISPNNGSDLDEAVNYAVVHHLGNTISNSWSGLEGFGNPAQFDRVNRILEAAAVQGVDVNFSSGDYGDNVVTAGFKTVGFPGSSPFATSIGGTSLALNPDDSIMFQTGWGTNLTRLAVPATAGVPCEATCDPVVPPLIFGFQYGAGGGTSLTFAKPAFQSGIPGAARMVPDIAMLADPDTGVEIIETINGQLSVGVIGGTSLACPTFSAIMGIASQKAGHGLGQAAQLVYSLPAGVVTDIVPVAGDNVTGTINGSTPESADALAGPLDGTSIYYSALYNSPSSLRWDVLTFGTDSSLFTAPGWDDVTGVGTPNGWNFVNALAP